MDELLIEIEKFCRKHQMRESRFGRDAVNDTSLVPQLRSGREMRRATRDRIHAFMAGYVPASRRTEQAQAAAA